MVQVEVEGHRIVPAPAPHRSDIRRGDGECDRARLTINRCHLRVAYLHGYALHAIPVIPVAAK